MEHGIGRIPSSGTSISRYRHPVPSSGTGSVLEASSTTPELPFNPNPSSRRGALVLIVCPPRRRLFAHSCNVSRRFRLSARWRFFSRTLATWRSLDLFSRGSESPAQFFQMALGSTTAATVTPRSPFAASPSCSKDTADTRSML